MSMLHSVTTEREADTGEAGRATHDGRSAGQPKEAPKYVASDQDIFTAAETSASTLHTAGTPKVHPMHRRIYWTALHRQPFGACRSDHPRTQACPFHRQPRQTCCRTNRHESKWWRHSSVLKWRATSYRLNWAPKRWKRILAFTITFELVL